MLYLIKGFLIYDKLIDHRHLFFACCRGGFYAAHRNHFLYSTGHGI